jgi:hypothetical protein
VFYGMGRWLNAEPCWETMAQRILTWLKERDL